MRIRLSPLRWPWPAQIGHNLGMFLLLLLVSTLAWAEPDRPSPDIVTIGVVADNEPYVFFEGRRPTGFSIDVLRLVGEQSNVVFDFRAGSWPEIFSAFQRGDLDAIDGISWRPDRAESILFTDPYHVRGISMMADSARSLPVVNELADLYTLRVGVVEDIFYISELEDAGIEPVTYDSIPSLVRALAYGWIDVAVGPELTLTYTANRGSFRFLSIIGSLPLTQFEGEDFRIGVRTDNPVLSKRLQDGLQAIPRRQINDLLARWQDFGGALARADSGTTLSASQQQYLDSLGPIRVGFMEDYAPFSFTEGGRVLGLSVDVMDRLGDLAGLQVVPVRGRWEELLTMFRNGDIDVLANMSYRPEREQYTRFSRPYYAIPNVIFTRNPDLDYATLTDLEGYRVGLGVGIFYENAVRETLDAGQITTYDAQEPMYRALARGDVDVVIGALHTGNFWIHQLGMSGVRIAGELILPDAAGEDLRFGVRPSLAPLADILSQTMERLTPTEQRVIETRWLGASSRPSTSTTPTWSDTERAWLAQHGQDIRFCVDPDWLPLEGLQGDRHVGLSAQVLDMFSQRAGITFTLVPTDTWPDSMAAGKARDCDLFPMVMETPDRLAYMDFTEPYLEIPNIVLGRIESPFIERLLDLETRPVGVRAEFAFAELLERRNPSLNLVPVESEEDALRRVQNGELAGYITTLATASYYMQSLGLADLKVLGRVPSDWSLAIATRNDQPELGSIMQKLVDSLTPEDQAALESGWRNVPMQAQMDYTLLWQILGAGLLLTFMLFYWNRKLGRLNRELAVANAALSRLSVTDNLTGLGNRAYFDRQFPQDFHRCQRHQTGFAIAMVDADLFKAINDTWGHDVGDRCLAQLAQVMQKHFRRDTDHLARFGGEEFVIFSSYDHAEDLLERMEQLRQAVAVECQQVNGGNTVNLTVSIGVALGVPGRRDTPAEFLRLADQALYRAKKQGRNRVESTPVSSV